MMFFELKNVITNTNKSLKLKNLKNYNCYYNIIPTNCFCFVNKYYLVLIYFL